MPLQWTDSNTRHACPGASQKIPPGRHNDETCQVSVLIKTTPSRKNMAAKPFEEDAKMGCGKVQSLRQEWNTMNPCAWTKPTSEATSNRKNATGEPRCLACTVLAAISPKRYSSTEQVGLFPHSPGIREHWWQFFQGATHRAVRTDAKLSEQKHNESRATHHVPRASSIEKIKCTAEKNQASIET